MARRHENCPKLGLGKTSDGDGGFGGNLQPDGSQSGIVPARDSEALAQPQVSSLTHCFKTGFRRIRLRPGPSSFTVTSARSASPNKGG